MTPDTLYWYIPVVPPGKSVFGPPNCPVIALCYYHRYITEHPELRKGRRRLIIPIKDNNAGQKASAATVSKWSALLHGFLMPYDRARVSL